MKNLLLLVVISLAALPARGNSVNQVSERAKQMAQEMIIVDGHIDVPNFIELHGVKLHGVTS